MTIAVQVKQLGDITSDAPQSKDVVKAAMGVLRKNVSEPVHLTLLNLGATNFVEAARPGGSGGLAPAISRLLSSGKAEGQDGGRGGEATTERASSSGEADTTVRSKLSLQCCNGQSLACQNK